MNRPSRRVLAGVNSSRRPERLDTVEAALMRRRTDDETTFAPRGTY